MSAWYGMGKVVFCVCVITVCVFPSHTMCFPPFPTEHSSPQMSRDILCEAINSLPTANRDTLAFLVQHLQK